MYVFNQNHNERGSDMLKEVAIAYYQNGYNCSESIIRAGNDVYQLGLNDRDMLMTAGFGAGLQIGDLCGALCGAVCVISARYVETKAHECEDLRPLTQKMVLAFQKKFGSRQCAQIKATYFDPALRCQNTVALGAQVLEEVINEWDKEKV